MPLVLFIKMEKNELIKKYCEFAKKNTLPEFKELDKEFFLSFPMSNIKDFPDNFHIYISNKISDYLNGWINFCHVLINGNPQSMILMKEAEFFDDTKKKEIIEVMRRLTILSRMQHIVNFKNDKKESAEFIKYVWSEWKKIKPKLLEYAQTSLDKWKTEK